MPKSKDECFVNGFNPMKRGAPGIRELKKKISDIAAQVEAKKTEAEKKAEEKNSKKNIEDDTESAYKMLLDMRSVYKSAGGRTKLLTLIKGDDKLLMTMVRELMKIEASLMATEIRNKEINVGGNTATFVILKGLQTDDEVMVVKKDGVVDIEQVTNAINPLSEPKIEYEEEMVRPE